MTAPAPRTRVVTAAFWCWVVASVMLMVGGLIAASVSLPALFRGAGMLTVAAGAGMAFLAGRIRTGDVRFRRAGVALSLTIVVFVVLLSARGIVHIVTLIAVLPLIAGAILVTRPGAAKQEEPT
ncbi:MULTISPECIES: hypothetical protein [unclassified Mycobacterium]|uniref:hypothetical protein n=1 Tax=unclassified Mycobacterium TaxID=2642494 RepID=UPI000740371C|nr:MULTISPECIES: hypothetical protein [unclassified Mycobacterium]KUH81948.1 hypothetical protein AU187_17350 [Mycobacterium sp. IS-1556]KUH82416.1 hypothetical protein AU185_22380 [Mycobacterium sp. GA-0227b]KUH88911.1 hypothetical protein AU186_08830 [Mycobacterium sp. GA-1999]